MDEHMWDAAAKRMAEMTEFSNETRRTVNAFRWLLQDLLAEVAALKPDPRQYLDETLTRFHGVIDEAAQAITERGDEERKLAEAKKSMIAAQREYEQIFGAVLKRLTAPPPPQ